jgi:heat shock protein HslJ
MRWQRPARRILRTTPGSSRATSTRGSAPRSSMRFEARQSLVGALGLSMLCGVAALVLASCTASRPQDPRPSPSTSVGPVVSPTPITSASASTPAADTSAWTLRSFVVNGVSFEPPKGSPMSIVIENGTIAGTAACNRYGASVTSEGASFSLESPITMTEVRCPGTGSEIERAYFGALAQVRTSIVGATDFQLEGNGVEMRFETLPPQPILEARERMWILMSAEGPSGHAVIKGTPTLYLRDDGGIAYDSGCYSRDGRYAVLPDEITVTSLTSYGDCDKPADQDLLVEAAIGMFSMSIEADQLTVTGGGATLTYRELQCCG